MLCKISDNVNLTHFLKIFIILQLITNKHFEETFLQKHFKKNSNQKKNEKNQNIHKKVIKKSTEKK